MGEMERKVESQAANVGRMTERRSYSRDVLKEVIGETRLGSKRLSLSHLLLFITF